MDDKDKEKTRKTKAKAATASEVLLRNLPKGSLLKSFLSMAAAFGVLSPAPYLQEIERS